MKLANGENEPRPEAKLTDFTLCQEQVALFVALSNVEDGARVTVEVKRGIPFVVEIEQDDQTA